MSTLPFINKQIYRNTAVTNSAVLVRSGRTDIFGWSLPNANASAVYIQLFDVADTSSVTLGTTAPTEVILIPASGQNIAEESERPWRQFTNGLAIAATTTATGSTAPGSATSLSISYR